MSPFGVVCHACGAGMPMGVRFCGKCGTTIDEKAGGSAKEEVTSRRAPAGIRLLLIAWGLGLLAGLMLGRGLIPTRSFEPDALPSGTTQEDENVESLLARGHAASDAGSFSTAKDLYRRVVAIEPANLPAQVNLGIALAALGEDTAARAAFLVALTGATPHPAAAYNLALLEEEAGRYDRARKFYGQYLALDPEGKKAAKAREKLSSSDLPAGDSTSASPRAGSSD
ncbi:MAG: tetratricopeptide repeat protein [Deltaproteobacteria bacterium]|nr:tetratricopeptide repeat protein [Deltaproteobacteria bacterium]